MESLDKFRAINIRLDSQRDYIPDGIIIKQGDVNGRLVKLRITDYGTPIALDGVSALLSYERPDHVRDIARFTKKDGYLECAIPEKAGEVAGNVLVEIQVTGTDFIVGTRNFILKCEKSPASYDKIVKSNSYQDLIGISDTMLALESDAKQIKADAESTLQAQAERGEAIIAKEQKDFDDAQASQEQRYTNAEAERERRFQSSQTTRTSEHKSAQNSREQDYQRWKSSIAGDAESRIQAKEQLFSQAQSSAELKWERSLTEHESTYQASINAANQAKTQFDTNAQSALKDAKDKSDEQFRQIDAIKESYAGNAPLTTQIADARYTAKTEFDTFKQSAATKSELDPLATKQELSGYIKDGSKVITADKLAESYVKTADAFTKEKADVLYAGKSTATTSANGLMSASDKTKIDSVESGAQRNTVTSVNGKTGAVTIPTVDLSPYVTKTDAQQTYQPKGNYQAAGSYVTASKHTSDLALKQDKGSYVESTDILKIKVVSSIPSTGEPNTLYLVKEA